MGTEFSLGKIIQPIYKSLKNSNEVHQRKEWNQLDITLLFLSSLAFHPVPNENIEHNCVDNWTEIDPIDNKTPNPAPISWRILNPAPKTSLPIGVSDKRQNRKHKGKNKTKYEDKALISRRINTRARLSGNSSEIHSLRYYKCPE